MRLDIPHRFISKHHNIELVATEFTEPNYGRFLWKYKFLIDTVLVENKYMNYSYGGLVGNLDNFCLESDNGKYVYLPLIHGALIYEPVENLYFEMPSIGEGKNNSFVKNIFVNERLIILYERSIQIIDLPTKTIQSVIFSVNKYKLVDVSYNDALHIIYLNLTDGKEYSNDFDFKSMNFKN